MDSLNYTALIIFTIALAIAAGSCIYMEHKIAELNAVQDEEPDKFDSMMRKIQTGEILISDDKFTSYLLAKKETEEETNIFISKVGDAWGSLGVLLGIIAVLQGGIVINGYIKSKAWPNKRN